MNSLPVNGGLAGLIIKPRGFCAGVERAIRAVELALDEFGPPIYVRKEIVHNTHVVQRLRDRGAIFVDELGDVPQGAVAILSAHGSAPQVYAEAAARDLRIVDATCPLVTKVHVEVRRYVKRGYAILLIGHAGHDEVIGTIGQAPEHTRLIEDLDDVAALDLRPNQPAVILTQTTLSQDDTQEIIDALLKKFAWLELPPTEDICYATQNRQNAVKAAAPQLDLLLVVGSQNSSNSRRLVEVARSRGIDSHLIDSASEIDPMWLSGKQRIGVTSGASAPEDIVLAVVEYLRERGVEQVDEMNAPDENVVFSLPKFATSKAP